MDEKQKTANSYSLLRKLDENNSAAKKKTSSSSSKKSYNESSSSRYEGGLSRSTEKEKKSKKRLPKEEIDYNLPDVSFGDMYCKICDAHMNSDLMWKAHIQGKRHLKNIKKECPEKKYFDIDEESKLQEEIDTVKKPIVGLDYVIEIQKCDTEIPLFQCFLCNANLPSSELVIEHLLGLKHRMAYLSKHNPEQFELLERTKFKKNLLEPIVEEEIAKLERKLGRGRIAVKLAKPKPADPFKRPAVEEDRMSPKRTRNDSATFGHWKPLDSEMRHNYEVYYPHPPEEKQLHFPKYPEEQRMALLDDSRYEDRRLNVGKTNNASHSSERKYDRVPWMADVERLIQSSKNNPYSSSSQKKIDLNELEVASFIQRVNERSSRTLGERSYSGDSPKIDYEKTKKETNPLAEFVKALYSLPSVQFLAIVKTKLETMSIQTKEELKALTKLNEQIQAIILSRQLDELGPDVQKTVSEFLKSSPATAIPGWIDILNQIQRNDSTNLQNTFSAHQDVSNFDRSVGCVGDGRYSQSTLIPPKSPPLPPPETSSTYSLFGPSSSTSIPGLSLSEDQSNISSGFPTATRRSTVNDTSSGNYSHFQGFNSFVPEKYWN